MSLPPSKKKPENIWELFKGIPSAIYRTDVFLLPPLFTTSLLTCRGKHHAFSIWQIIQFIMPRQNSLKAIFISRTPGSSVGPDPFSTAFSGFLPPPSPFCGARPAGAPGECPIPKPVCVCVCWLPNTVGARGLGLVCSHQKHLTRGTNTFS